MKIFNTSSSVTVCLFFWLCIACPADAFQAVAPAPKKANMTRAEFRYDLLKNSCQRLQVAIAMLRDDIGKKQKRLDSMNISPVAFDEVMRMLQTKRINLMIELAGLDVRQQEAKKLAAESTGGSGDGFLKHLDKLADDAQSNVQRIQGRLGSKHPQVLEAQRLLAEAESKKAEYQASRSQSTLVEVSVARAERIAQLKVVEELLKQYVGEARGVIADIDMKNKRLNATVEELYEQERELGKLNELLEFDRHFEQQLQDDH